MFIFVLHDQNTLEPVNVSVFIYLQKFNNSKNIISIINRV